jgi:hypothetical protein
MLKAIKSDQKTIATAGTAVALVATKTDARGLQIKALAGNTGAVYIGQSGVTAATGVELSPGQTYDVGDFLGTTADLDPFVDLNQIYVDTATNGNKVCLTWWDNVPG